MIQKDYQAFLEDDMTNGAIPVRIDITKDGERIRIKISNKVSMTLVFDADVLLEIMDKTQ